MDGDSYSLALVTAPTALPISVAETKEWLRQTVDEDDALIHGLIVMGTDLVERFIGRQLVTATWRMAVDEFPARGAIRFPKAPLQSVSSVSYYDADNVSQTLATTVYDVDAESDPGRLSLAYGQSWPATRRRPGAVRLTFVAGYGLPVAVPTTLKTVLKFGVAHAYEHRGDDTDSTSLLTTAMRSALMLYWSGAMEYGEGTP